MKAPTDEQLQAACAALEKIIGETTVADGITTTDKESGWRRVVEELIRLSIEDARSMGEGCLVNKQSYTLLPDQWVHARARAMIVELSAWMGMQWESHGLGGEGGLLAASGTRLRRGAELRGPREGGLHVA